MAPETQEQNNGSASETEGQEQQGQQQAPAGEKPGNGEQQPVTIDDSTKLPETHPLVKTLLANKTKIADQARELAEARSQAGKSTQLEQDLAARPTTEAMEALQNRNDRLEEFLVAAGGPLGRALDSRTFTKDLFETDKPVADLVKSFLRANPSATSAALGGGSNGGQGGTDKKDPNELIRIAARK